MFRTVIIFLKVCQLLNQVRIERNTFQELVLMNALIVIVQKNRHILQIRNTKRWNTNLT